MSKKQVVHSREGESPLVLSMPHSASLNSVADTFIPDCVRDNVDLNDPEITEAIRMARDSGVEEATGFHDQAPHSLVWTVFPRFLLDVNREETDVDGSAVEGKGAPAHAHGIIFRSTIGRVKNLSEAGRAPIKSALKRPYTPAEFEQMLQEAHRPYIQATRQLMGRALEKHGFSVMLDLHTFPANTTTKIQDGPFKNAYVLGPRAQRAPVTSVQDVMQGKMPDLWMISNWDHQNGKPRSCHPVIAEIIREEFEKADMFVTNGMGPFQGNNGCIAMHADPAQGKHVVGLELVGHELTPGRDRGIEEVNRQIAAVFRGIYQKIFNRLACLKADDLKAA
ncbi:MAG: N-formylglutamate amidohydrolase [Candidatus Peregrinibacteria bacterium]